MVAAHVLIVEMSLSVPIPLMQYTATKTRNIKELPHHDDRSDKQSTNLGAFAR